MNWWNYGEMSSTARGVAWNATDINNIYGSVSVAI